MSFTERVIKRDRGSFLFLRTVIVPLRASPARKKKEFTMHDYCVLCVSCVTGRCTTYAYVVQEAAPSKSELSKSTKVSFMFSKL